MEESEDAHNQCVAVRAIQATFFNHKLAIRALAPLYARRGIHEYQILMPTALVQAASWLNTDVHVPSLWVKY